ncbi:MAG: hypothetical protein ACXAC5_04925 [Promethearchaeota archaeon]|jgi:hypothetical protein
MDKPVKKTMEYLDFNECQEWINHKYNINIRNYAGMKFTGKPDDPPYQDFWHSILHRTEINRGSFFWLDIGFWKDDDRAPDWEKEILKMFEDEFEEYIEGDGIEFWVDW